MTNWENEIVVKNIERTLSIVFQLQNVNEFEKSIADGISGTEDFRVEKTGKEVKEKLQVELTIIAGDKVAAVAKMGAFVAGIGSMPNGSTDKYYIQGFERYISEIPRIYSYEQLYPKQTPTPDPETNECSPMDIPILPTSGNVKTTQEKMREYNQIATDYIRRCVEEVKLKTVIGNLPDGKKIKLAPQLAAELGF